MKHITVFLLFILLSGVSLAVISRESSSDSDSEYDSDQSDQYDDLDDELEKLKDDKLTLHMEATKALADLNDVIQDNDNEGLLGIDNLWSTAKEKVKKISGGFKKTVEKVKAKIETRGHPDETPNPVPEIKSHKVADAMLQLIQAAFKALEADPDLEAKECFSEADTIYNAIIALSTDFSAKMTLDSMTDVVSELEKILNAMSSTFDNCKVKNTSLKDKFSKVIGTLEKCFVQADKYGQMVIEGISVVGQIKTVIDDFHGKNYEQAGKDLASLIQALPDSQDKKLHMIITFAKKFGVDLSKGITCYDDTKAAYEAIEDFLKDLPSFSDAEGIIADFEKIKAKVITWKTVGGKVKDAFDHISTALTKFGTAMTDCMTLVPQNDKAKKIFDAATKIQSGVWAIEAGVSYVFEGEDLSTSIKTFYTDCKEAKSTNENWAKCAGDLGDIGTILANTKDNPGFHAFAAFVEKIGGKVSEVASCVDDGATAYDDIMTFVKAFPTSWKDISVAKAKEVLSPLASSIEVMGKALSDCGVDKLGGKATTIATRLEKGFIAVGGGMKLAIDAVDVIGEVKDVYGKCKTQVEAKDYLDCGDAIGGFLTALPTETNADLEIVLGMARKLGQDIFNVDKCLGDIKSIKEDIEEIRDLMIGPKSSRHSIWHTKEGDVKKALQKLVSTLETTADALNACDITGIAGMIGVVAGKTASGIGEIEIGVKIMIHGVNIYEDIVKAVSDYKDNDYVSCGIDIGGIVYNVYTAVAKI